MNLLVSYLVVIHLPLVCLTSPSSFSKTPPDEQDDTPADTSAQPAYLLLPPTSCALSIAWNCFSSALRSTSCSSCSRCTHCLSSSFRSWLASLSYCQYLVAVLSCVTWLFWEGVQSLSLACKTTELCLVGLHGLSNNKCCLVLVWLVNLCSSRQLWSSASMSTSSPLSLQFSSSKRSFLPVDLSLHKPWQFRFCRPTVVACADPGLAPKCRVSVS